LLRNIEHYSQLGDIVIQGEFNAYTNTVPDFVISDNTEFPRPIDNEYSIDSHISRNNLDNKPINKSGKLLFDLCKESGIRILNGKTIGDLRGKSTCITYNGRNVVDYTLVSCNLLHGIGNFIVNDFTPLSDHCPISCSILTCFQGDNNGMNANLDPMPGKLIWDEETISRYNTNNQIIQVKQKLEETAVKILNSILCDTALKSTKFVKKRMGKRSSKQNKKPWFSDSCHDLYITVQKSCSLVNKFPENGSHRKAFYSFRSKFRRKSKHDEKIYRNQICDKIFQNMKSDAKTFWNLLKMNPLIKLNL
jgi:hypothetical protein